MISFIVNPAILVLILLIARKFEKRTPIEAKQPTAAVVVDWKLAAFKWSASELLKPVTSASTILLVITVQIAVQLRRMNNEEAVLTASFPEYDVCRQITARLIAGVY